MRIKSVDSYKALKTVPGSGPITSNKFKDVLLKTIQVGKSMIT